MLASPATMSWATHQRPSEYILTNVRLIKLDISQKCEEMKSSDFFLHKLNIEWRVSTEGTETKLSSPTHSVILRYSPQNIADFFKK